MDFPQEFNTGSIFDNPLFDDHQASELDHSEFHFDNELLESIPQHTNEKTENPRQEEINSLQQILQTKHYLLSLNQNMQNQLQQQLAVINTLLSKSTPDPFSSMNLHENEIDENSNTNSLSEMNNRKESTRRFLESFPVSGSSLYFSKRRKIYPHYISSNGVPLTFATSPDPVHIQYWNEEDNEKLQELVNLQCQKLITSGSVPLSLQTLASNYLTTNDDYQKEILLQQMLPTLINHFSWEMISFELGHSTTDCFVHWINECDPFINTSPWTIEEDSKLKSLVDQYKETNWLCISKDLNTCRSPFQCFERYVTVLEMKDYNVKWTAEEDALILKGVQQYGTKSWKKVASLLPTHTWNQCRSRYYQSLLQETKRGHWSMLEDSRLLLILFFYGITNWNEISKKMITRKPAQCRDHWFNILYPNIDKKKWTKQEDMKLLQLTNNKDQIVWKKIVKYFPNRTADACKTRYNCLMKYTFVVCFSHLILFFNVISNINEIIKIVLN